MNRTNQPPKVPTKPGECVTVLELSEYADFLGLDLEAEPHLVWIARAGLKAPLPKQWKPWLLISHLSFVRD